jgi:putative glycosyltransferase (TIGR04348 family)
VHEHGHTAAIVHPAHPGSRGGNRVTALRWAKILRELGWHVFLEAEWSGRPCDLAVVLHARKSRASLVRLDECVPRPHLIVALAGTEWSAEDGSPLEPPAIAPVLASLARADRIVALQECMGASLPAELQRKLRVIHQSLPRPSCVPERSAEGFEVVLLANLRAVKNPMLAARAARALRAHSRSHVLHAGAALDEELGREAARESAENPRYTWLGPLPRARALALLARARIALSTSRSEGGANAVSEALALDVPILATRIPGNVGILGADHPGLYEADDAGALAGLIERAEQEPAFLELLASAGRSRAWIAERPRERAAWQSLLAEIGASPAQRTP